jgi:hypothetical protein
MDLPRRIGVAWRPAMIAAFSMFVLVAPAASAHHGNRSTVAGDWTNPVGACVGHITNVDPATGDLLGCSGTSDWTGTWSGSTTWTLTGDISLTAGGSGRIDEVFSGHAADGRVGTLTFVEHFTLDATGHIDIKGKIVKASGEFAGSRGHAHWIGTANADGSGAGTYSGRWHERCTRHHKRHPHD